MPSLAALALVVHITNLAAVPPAVLRDAQVEVAALFHDIDVTIEWQADAPRDGAHVEARLILLRREEGALRGSFVTVLGAAVRKEGGGGTAWIFYDRVAHRADQNAVPLSRLLACAIAHELGHVVQPLPSHSDLGLMRANWGEVEYRMAALGRLKFSGAELIR